jgi:hypothetical protein
MSQTGLYLYAVVESPGVAEAGLAGMDGATVEIIAEGPVAAVVSEVPNRKLRPERRRLAAHFEVVKHLLARQTVLPMAFGTVADDEEAVRGILVEHRDSFLDQLRRFAGRVEMGLRVQLDVENPFAWYVDQTPALKALRDQVFAGGEPSHDDRLELGRAFDEAQSERRRLWADEARRMLAMAEVKELKPRTEKELLNTACLVRAEDRQAFEDAVTAWAGRHGDEIAFDLTGPFPPYNFLEVELQV